MANGKRSPTSFLRPFSNVFAHPHHHRAWLASVNRFLSLDFFLETLQEISKNMTLLPKKKVSFHCESSQLNQQPGAKKKMRLDLFGLHHSETDIALVKPRWGYTTSQTTSVEWTKSSGWWCNNPLEKYEFVNGKDDPIYYGR